MFWHLRSLHKNFNVLWLPFHVASIVLLEIFGSLVQGDLEEEGQVYTLGC